MTDYAPLTPPFPPKIVTRSCGAVHDDEPVQWSNEGPPTPGPQRLSIEEHGQSCPFLGTFFFDIGS